MSNRNNLVELERFLNSLIVVGYHIQSAFVGQYKYFFKNGAAAVEFFFVVSGYFFARSIEKINAKDEKNIVKDTFVFLKNKIKTILPVHIVCTVFLLIFAMIIDIHSFGKTLLNGLPGIFLVQMAIVWEDSMLMSFNIPEWYISTMLLCMLAMTPISLLLRRKINGIFVTLILFAFDVVIVVVVGILTNLPMLRTFVMDARGWVEMCIGMFSYYFSCFIAKKEFNNWVTILLTVFELLGYNVPIILGFVPIHVSMLPLIMGITVLFSFFALSITFSNKGLTIKKEKINNSFGFLGNISLPIYIFHAFVVKTLIGSRNIPIWAIFLISFSGTIILSIIYKFAYDGIKKLVEHKMPEEQNANSEIYIKLV
ncbi:hypothetical protein M9Y10_040015 [Tritrichomonas musculus]|uniref:Acyltransferase 3 domain-containing protein n=1 Tax=Tritrichomonas musculus TaxID=1915356 RepID=A0ABR2GS34_9EUKA